MNRQQLARRIAELALLRGQFTLRSGRTSSYYLDKYRFETDPELLRELGRMLAEHVQPEVDRIAGAELGAVPLAAATSMACGKPYLIVRNRKKDYGTGKLVEGLLERGQTVMLVEDVLTTGGQALEAAQALQEAGARIDRIVAVIDRMEGARQNIEAAGFRLHTLLTVEDLGIRP